MKQTVLPSDAPLGLRIKAYLDDRYIRHGRIAQAMGVREDNADGALSRLLNHDAHRPSLKITRSMVRRILSELNIKPRSARAQEWLELAEPD